MKKTIASNGLTIIAVLQVLRVANAAHTPNEGKAKHDFGKFLCFYYSTLVEKPQVTICRSLADAQFDKEFLRLRTNCRDEGYEVMVSCFDYPTFVDKRSFVLASTRTTAIRADTR